VSLLWPSVVLKMRVFRGPYSLIQATTASASVGFTFGSAGAFFGRRGICSCRPVASGRACGKSRTLL
jgi:hypothetical protein